MAPWTEIADRKLLLTLIDLKAKRDWEYSARLMGPGYSAEACRQHFRKLKDELEEMIATSAAASIADTKDSTTNTTSPAPAPAARRKRKAETTTAAETTAAPTKKRSRRAVSAATKNGENESE